MLATAGFAVALVVTLLRLAPRLKEEEENDNDDDNEVYKHDGTDGSERVGEGKDNERDGVPAATTTSYQSVRSPRTPSLKKGLSFAS